MRRKNYKRLNLGATISESNRNDRFENEKANKEIV